jgi:hypothetical protein
MKKAWQTTEFWAMLIPNVVGIIVVTGIVGAEEGEELGNALKSIAGAIISIATTMGYIKGRADVKKARADAISSWNVSSVVGNKKECEDTAAAETAARDHVVACIQKLGV